MSTCTAKVERAKVIAFDRNAFLDALNQRPDVMAQIEAEVMSVEQAQELLHLQSPADAFGAEDRERFPFR